MFESLDALSPAASLGRPGNTLLAHEVIGKLCLGLNPDYPQRWG